MAVVELHVNAAYYAQHPPLKWVYGKIQSVIGGKLILIYRTVFELTQGLRDCTIPKKIQTGGFQSRFQIVVKGEGIGIGNYTEGRVFLLGEGNLSEWFCQVEPFSKLKKAFCEYWTSTKIKINMV